MLTKQLKKRDGASLPFTIFNLKRVYWSLFLFFTIIMLLFIFIKG